MTRWYMYVPVPTYVPTVYWLAPIGEQIIVNPVTTGTLLNALYPLFQRINNTRTCMVFINFN
jgi:hypothetical protein